MAKAAWEHTAQLLAMQYNINAPAGKKINPSKLNPFHTPEKRLSATKEVSRRSLQSLAGLKRKQPKENVSHA